MLDCLVIGGGHCGLLCAHFLAQAGKSYLVVDSSARVGDVWRQRPRSLRLFTSRRFCALGDFLMDGDPNNFPTGAEFADHVERFARAKELSVSFNTEVVRLYRAAGVYVAELRNGDEIHSATVINATGSNQTTKVPEFARQLNPSVRQIPAQSFRDASDLPSGTSVVVVGDGASGRQIALELADGRQVSLARGRKRALVPNVILGRDVFWWLGKIGLLFAERDTLVAKIMQKRDPVPIASANDTRLLAAGVNLKARAVGAEDADIVFSDGSRQTTGAVVWCGGYHENLDWIALPSINRHDSLSQDQGRTPEDGFYVVGRKWLTCRASELILGAQHDAARVVGYVTAKISNGGEPAHNTNALS